ncbi:hypothetical protein JCM3775_001871 [Rhodotorula graminis]
MAAPSSSTYSALLRRSKLASLTPGVEQVYTTSPANLARGNWGLKRPLPQASTTTSPFVRLFDLDSPEGRTTFRKATREALYVKKWAETGVGLNSDAHNQRGSSNGTPSRAWDRLPVQSRFVDGDAPGAIRQVPATGHRQHAAAPPRMPNFFAMSEREFERFLADLGERRDEFRTFVLREAASSGQQAESADDFDLYAHAQRNPLELVRLVERFLRLPSSTSPSSPAPAPSSANTLPQVHPTLALQYASPTPLESALAAPIPGRLLGPSPDASSSRGGGFAAMYGPRSEVYASLLSQVAPVPSSATAGTPSTSFFPDATGARSNLPGRAHFRLQAPTINPIPYASRTAITRSGVRHSTEFRPPTAEYEPSVLALRSVDLRAQVVPSAQVAVPKPLPGTPAYSGDLPPEVARYGAGRGGALGAGGRPASSLTDLYAATGSLRSLGVKGKPKDLLASRKNRRSKEDQDRWVRQREALLEQSGQDARAYAAKGRKDGERQQGKGHGKGGRREQTGKKLISRLEELLDSGNQ